VVQAEDCRADGRLPRMAQDGNVTINSDILCCLMAGDEAKPRYRWQTVVACSARSGLAEAPPPILIGDCGGAVHLQALVQAALACSERPEVVPAPDVTKHGICLPWVRGGKQLFEKYRNFAGCQVVGHGNRHMANPRPTKQSVTSSDRMARVVIVQ